jgi:hypothetical protein
VSLTIPFAGRRDRRKHSPDTVIRNLRDDIAKLMNRQAAADDYFAILTQDRDDVYAAWRWAEQQRQEAEMVAACVQSERDEWRDEALRLRAKFGPQLAAEANATRIDVQPMVRDTTAIEDQATGPIYVQPLWDAAAAGLLGPVTDPGRVTA